MEEALTFLRWEINRWLGTLDYIRGTNPQLSPETGAMGTMLARAIKASCNDETYASSRDLYDNSWTSKKGNA